MSKGYTRSSSTNPATDVRFSLQASMFSLRLPYTYTDHSIRHKCSSSTATYGLKSYQNFESHNGFSDFFFQVTVASHGLSASSLFTIGTRTLSLLKRYSPTDDAPACFLQPIPYASNQPPQSPTNASTHHGSPLLASASRCPLHRRRPMLPCPRVR